MAESQGVLADRSQEFLSASDRAVVRLRRLLVDAAKDYQSGRTPRMAIHADIPYSQVRAAGKIVSPEVHWRDVVRTVDWA
ncbi:hypothetical protein [Hydrocarboniphaga sp.]|uniref:hypothetical protein n=1 Tax=Hydrocarboniphaga sp. TaxID=2033016 RepID=UPI00262E6469|nr:hypothetical protein [Hydrocarboniphaga sp.]